MQVLLSVNRIDLIFIYFYRIIGIAITQVKIVVHRLPVRRYDCNNMAAIL